MGEIAQSGVRSSLANLMPSQGADARDKCLVTVPAIGNQGTQRAQGMRRDQPGARISIGSDAGGIRS
jgi:hypothetical protein